MKKIFALIVVAVLAVTNVKAQHEIGAVVGGLNGVSYKYWFDDALALQTDLAVGLTQAAYKNISAGQYDFTVNPNALYHFDLVDALRLYTGGGINFGLAGGLGTVGGVRGANWAPANRISIDPDDYDDYDDIIDKAFRRGGGTTVMGKFGINAVIGLAYEFEQAPVVLAFDFRPGYGMNFNDIATSHYFDWKLCLGVRYAF